MSAVRPAPAGGREFWDTVAEAYGTQSSFFEQASQALVSAAGISGGESVADIACGTGATLLCAAARVGHRGMLTGVDHSLAMAARASQALAGRADARTCVVVGDVRALPLPGDAYDVVLCGLGMGFFTDRTAAVAEVARVLRAGGRFLWSVAAGGSSEWAFLGRAYARFGLLRTMTDARSRTPVALPPALRGAGLIQGPQTRHLVEVRFSTVDAWWQWLMATGMRELINQLGPAAMREFQASVTGDAARIADASGLLLRQNLIVKSAVKQTVPAM